MCKHIEEPHACQATAQPTFEELRDAAEKLGYRLVKKRTYISLKPCPICGKKYTAVWYSMVEPRGDFRKCGYCDFRSDAVAKKSDLNQAWNDAVDRYLKEKEENNESI